MKRMSVKVLLLALTFTTLTLTSAFAEQYKFKVANNTRVWIKKILVSENGRKYGFFDIGKGIRPGQTMTLVWARSTNKRSASSTSRRSTRTARSPSRPSSTSAIHTSTSNSTTDAGTAGSVGCSRLRQQERREHQPRRLVASIARVRWGRRMDPTLEPLASKASGMAPADAGGAANDRRAGVPACSRRASSPGGGFRKQTGFEPMNESHILRSGFTRGRGVAEG
jgi:hypothetical protein